MDLKDKLDRLTGTSEDVTFKINHGEVFFSGKLHSVTEEKGVLHVTFINVAQHTEVVKILKDLKKISKMMNVTMHGYIRFLGELVHVKSFSPKGVEFSLRYHEKEDEEVEAVAVPMHAVKAMVTSLQNAGYHKQAEMLSLVDVAYRPDLYANILKAASVMTNKGYPDVSTRIASFMPNGDITDNTFKNIDYSCEWPALVSSIKQAAEDRVKELGKECLKEDDAWDDTRAFGPGFEGGPFTLTKVQETMDVTPKGKGSVHYRNLQKNLTRED
jgi:hypothetical protein